MTRFRRASVASPALLLIAVACGAGPAADVVPVEAGGEGGGDPAGIGAPALFLGPFLALTAADGWTLVSVEGRPPLPGATVTLFPGRGSLGGHGGCNAYGGSVQGTPGGGIALGGLSSTAMACVAEDVTAQESDFLRLLGSVTDARLDGERLVLDTGERPAVLAFEPIPPPRGEIDDLLGTAWRAGDGSAAADFTIALPGEGVAFGRAACRAWVADYRTRRSTVGFTTVSMAGDPCDDRAVEEGELMDVLTWARDVVIDGERWTLRTTRGDALRFEALPPSGVEGRWRLMSMREGDGPLEYPRPSPTPTLEVAGAELRGHTGCNRFEAAWSGDPTRPAVARPVATQMACEDRVMAVERSVLGLLGAAGTLFPAGDLLWVGTPGGGGLLFQRDGGG